jgi:ribose transport system ATP-binding protein
MVDADLETAPAPGMSATQPGMRMSPRETGAPPGRAVAEHLARPQPALSITGLSKSFGGTRALSDFSLTIQPGEIHVLVGQNGSGKSTLIKVLSGYHLPDAGGEVLASGERLQFGSADHAYRLGCRFVHQDLGLIASASVLDNLFLGSGFPTRMATIRQRAAIAAARENLRQAGLDVNPRSLVADLPAAQRTGVAVARALRPDPLHPARVLVLDEPTATLPTDEVDHLLDILRTAARRQVAILFVTHHLDEVFRIADRVTILRDGVVVSTSPIAEIDQPTLVEQLVGDVVEEARRSGGRPSGPPAVTALQVEGLTSGVVRDMSLCVSRGEIVGLAGLTGSGRERALGAIFGAVPRDAGLVSVGGRVVSGGRPDLAVAAGLGFLPGDRQVHGGIMNLNARENLTLPDLRPFWSRLHLHHKQEMAETRRWFARLMVRPADAVQQPLASFSGGNQQKVLFGKWLRQRPSAFLLDEPTQGVDVGAKAELHRQLLTLAAEGTAVLLSSTDIEELAALCDRVVVFRAGRIAHELNGDQLTSAEITRCVVSDPAGQGGNR